MPVVDPTRLAEVYLAVGNTALTDYLDLLPPINMWLTAYTFLPDSMSVQGSATMRGMTIDRVASGKASTTGEAPEVVVFTIPIAVAGGGTQHGTTAGGTVIANEQALRTKIREATRGAGAFALNTSVYLWWRPVGTPNYAYWNVIPGDVGGSGPKTMWQPLLTKQPLTEPIIAGILTLVCLPFAQGDPITDPVSTVLTPASPQLYRAAIPGDVRALTRLWVTDLSGNSLIGQRLTLYGRSLDGMGSSDWTATYAATPISPGVAASGTPAGALGGTYARLTTSGAWQTLSGASSPAGAFQSMTDVDVIAKLRDGALPLLAPQGFTIAQTANTGTLGSGNYIATVIPYNAAGKLGPPAGQVAFTITNYGSSGGQPLAMSTLFQDTFETGDLTLEPAPIVIQGTTSTASVAVNGTAKYAGSYGAELTAASGTTATQGGGVALTFPAPPLTTSHRQSFQFVFDPVAVESALNTTVRHFTAAVVVGSASGTPITFGLYCDGTNWWAAYVSASFPNIWSTATNSNPPWCSSNASILKVSAAQTLSNAFHRVEITADVSGVGSVALKLTVSNADGTSPVVWGGFTTNPLTTSPSETIDFWYVQTACAYDGTHSTTEHMYFDNIVLTDQYIGGGTVSSGATFIGTWDAVTNATGYHFDWNVNNTWFGVDVGNVLTYTVANPFPTGVVVNVLPPTGAPSVQPTEVRVGYGIASTDLEYTQSVQCNVSNAEWEARLIDTIPLPPSEIPEGMIAPPWTFQLQARNLGSTTPTIDNDEFFVVPHDGDSLTLTAPSTLSGPAVWMIDDRRDHRVTAILYATAKVTAAGNEVTDATRAAATLDDGIAVPGGYGLYPSGTVLTHGTVGGNPRVQALATGQLNATTAWFALTFIPENTAANRRCFCWSSGAAAEVIECFYTGTAFELIRQHSTTGANITVNYAEVIGTPVTVMGYWTATTLGLSVNGSAFATVGNTNIPSGLGANFDIGSRASISNGSTDLYGAVQWFAAGLGTPTAADAAIVATRGTTCPTPDDFSAAANLQLVWSARQTVYWTDTILGGADVAGELAIGPANAIVCWLMEYLDGSGNFISDQQYANVTIQPSLRPRFGFARANT